jgi:DNA replicative helicase MCM subunit Mcm2 (Cdc46/Mcm family)
MEKCQNIFNFIVIGKMKLEIGFFIKVFFLYRNLVDRAMPGNKITLVGIYCIKRNIPMGKVNSFEKKSN